MFHKTAYTSWSFVACQSSIQSKAWWYWREQSVSRSEYEVSKLCLLQCIWEDKLLAHQMCPQNQGNLDWETFLDHGVPNAILEMWLVVFSTKKLHGLDFIKGLANYWQNVHVWSIIWRIACEKRTPTSLHLSLLHDNVTRVFTICFIFKKHIAAVKDSISFVKMHCGFDAHFVCSCCDSS